MGIECVGGEGEEEDDRLSCEKERIREKKNATRKNREIRKINKCYFNPYLDPGSMSHSQMPVPP